MERGFSRDDKMYSTNGDHSPFTANARGYSVAPFPRAVGLDGSDQTLPYSDDGEKGLLCSLLLSPRDVALLCASLPADAFYIPAHRILYELILDFNDQGKPVDFVTVKQALKDRNLLEEVGGPQYLDELYAFVPTAANAKYYLEIVREKYARRNFILECRRASDRATEQTENVDALIDEAVRRIQAIIDRQRRPDPSEEELKAQADAFYLTGDTGFPLPIAKEAYHGLAGEIVRIIGPESEASPEAVLVQFLVAFGNLLGRPLSFYQAAKHRLNLFAVVVGSTSRGRKGTSWMPVEDLLRHLDPRWADEQAAGGIQSGEAIIYSIRDARGEDPGVTDKRLLIKESEFARLLSVSGRSGNTLSAVLRDAWDSPRHLRNKSKTSPDKATDPHVSLIGHITKEDLQALMKTIEHANGFSNRVLWVATRRTKKIARPNYIEWDKHFPDTVAKLRAVRGRFRGVEPGEDKKMRFSREGEEAWETFYQNIDDSQRGSIGAILAREEAQVLRLSMAFGALDSQLTIEPQHLTAARAVWAYCRASAFWAFTNSTGNRLADNILWALQRNPQGLTRKELMVDVAHRNCSKVELDQALSILKGNGQADVRYEKRGSRGPNTEIWFTP
jgi:hypothetical protein